MCRTRCFFRVTLVLPVSEARDAAAGTASASAISTTMSGLPFLRLSLLGMTPVFRIVERALPDAAAGGAGFAFERSIRAGVAAVIDGVTAAHQLCAEIGDGAGRAAGEQAAIAILTLGSAGERALRHQCGEPHACRGAAGPAAAIGVAAGLPQFRRVDAGEADALGLAVMLGAQGVA